MTHRRSMSDRAAAEPDEDRLLRAVVRRATSAAFGYGAYAVACALVPADLGVGVAGAADPLTRADLRAWRMAGCQSCHSILGLGGHTGPDLTNLISRTSPEYVRAIVRAGSRAMPAYPDLQDADLRGIVRYLEAVDRAGSYPPASRSRPVFGDR